MTDQSGRTSCNKPDPARGIRGIKIQFVQDPQTWEVASVKADDTTFRFRVAFTVPRYAKVGETATIQAMTPKGEYFSAYKATLDVREGTPDPASPSTTGSVLSEAVAVATETTPAPARPEKPGASPWSAAGVVVGALAIASATILAGSRRLPEDPGPTGAV